MKDDYKKLISMALEGVSQGLSEDISAFKKCSSSRYRPVHVLRIPGG
jgi:hypothetical protein